MELERFRLKATGPELFAGLASIAHANAINARRQEGRCVMQRIIMAVVVLAAVGIVPAFSVSAAARIALLSCHRLLSAVALRQPLVHESCPLSRIRDVEDSV